MLFIYFDFIDVLKEILGRKCHEWKIEQIVCPNNGMIDAIQQLLNPIDVI